MTSTTSIGTTAVDEATAARPLSLTDAQSRMAELSERIRSADYAYYVLDAPIVSDAEYDAVMRELRDLERAYPELVVDQSPTRVVPGAPSAGFAKVRHLEPLLSLANAMTEDEVRR